MVSTNLFLRILFSCGKSKMPNLIKGLHVMLFCAMANVTCAQIKVDGILNIQEWTTALKRTTLYFDFGNCYYLQQNDTLFFAFDIIADNMDNIANYQPDRVDIYADANDNNIYDQEDYVFTAISQTNYGGLIKTCTSCKLQKTGNTANGIYATSFGTSVLFAQYSHRIWEIAIPLKLLPQKMKMGFACKISSALPQFSAFEFMDRNTMMFGSVLSIQKDSLLSMQKDRIIINPSKNTQAIQEEPDKSELVTGRSILDDGGVETSYADGHKRIDYSRGYTIIAPDGKRSMVLKMSVPALVPPSTPIANTVPWLESLNASLLSLIAEWVGHDERSIANMQAGESGKNIYEVINRRCSIINFLNPRK